MRKRLFQIEATSLFTMVLLPLFVLGLAVGMVNHYALTTEIDKSNERQMRYMAERVNSITNDLELLNFSLTTNPAVTLWLKGAMQHAAGDGIRESEYAVYNAVVDLIYASTYRNAHIDSIYIYFEDGIDTFISSEKRMTDLNEYSDTAWFDSYMQADPFVRTWSELRTAKDPRGEEQALLTIYCRIFAGGTGSDRGVLVLNIDQSAINAMIDSMDSSWDTAVCVVDAQGDVLFYNDQFADQYGQQSLYHILEWQASELLSGEELSAQTYMIDQQQHRCLSQPLNAYGWRMIRLCPVRSLYAAPRQAFFYMIVVLLGTMLFGVLFTYHLAQRNNQNINNVIRAIRRAKLGQRVHEEPPHQDAFGQTLQNVVDTFLENEYLTMQMAERHHHAKLLELQALQSQLNPHFLFNTMSTIQWKAMALTGGRNDASDMIEHLSDLLHYVLDTGTELTSLSEELAITETYAAIQKIRHADQFEYICRCDETLLDTRVMKMLIQPLVENSIAHGMSSDMQVLRVEVDVYAKDDSLHLRVRDNGIGMDAEKLELVRCGLDNRLTENGRHIGLYNVNKRIVLTYGEEYGLKIASAAGQGTDICLRLPLRSGSLETANDTSDSDRKG